MLLKIRTILLISLILLMLTACGAATETAPTPTTLPSTALPQPGTAPRATVTPAGATSDDTSGYPAPPTLTPYPEGYVGPDLGAANAPYPAAAGFVWIIRPSGLQCGDGLDYDTLEAAVAPLSQAGIEVVAQMSVNLMVCEACSCPTSLHYRAQIAEADVAATEKLGWTVDK